MRYHTTDELGHFNFQDAVVAAMRIHPGCFYLELDQVTITPDNSCNRDIRNMRTNGLCLRLQDGEILSFVREAYRVYDADGNLTQTEEDEPIDVRKEENALQRMENATVYEIVCRDGIYHIELDVEEYTYHIAVKASHDVEEWDRFLNLEE
ncbi:MAG: subtilin biosynthesis sensor protein SpaK [Lachnospiraceae bacterium]|nr:subtilin biosynthesis sensor protein SpaK [Lachnospiraceae bacterium]